MRRKAIISGASKITGQAITKMLGMRGTHDITIVGDQRKALDSLKEEISIIAPACHTHIVSANLADTEELLELCTTVRGIHDCDLLINCADYFSTATLDDCNKQMREVYETNFMASLHLSRAVLDNMKIAGSGKIINIPGYAEENNFFAKCYHKSKNPLLSFSDSLVKELLECNIKVTTIQMVYNNKHALKYLNGINDCFIRYAENIARSVDFILSLSDDMSIPHMRMEVL